MAGRWLLKTEPEEWSWEHQQANGGVSHWDGVRNALAQKHLRAMAQGDLCFFYHSGANAKEIVGIARVCKTFYPDPSDPTSKHGMIDIEAVSKLALPLSLSRLKQEDRLHSFIMFRQPRLSVVPVDSSEWDLICELAGQLQSPLPLDNDDISLKVCNAEARASPLSSDDNENVRLRVCNDDTIDKSTAHTRKRPKSKSLIDGSTSHGIAKVADFEIARTSGAKNSLDELMPHEERSSKVPEVSRAAELVPDSKRVYSRRNRKLRQLVGEAATPTSHENVQPAAKQQAGQMSMPTSANLSDMDSVSGRVYKKRDKRQVLVESLLC